MKVRIFSHSLRSCWSRGDAHVLRGVAAELLARRHDVEIFEPADGWSAASLAREEGPAALEVYREAYPSLTSTLYRPAALDLDRALDGADLVLVHEWTDPDLVARIGRHRRGRRHALLLHDTHHRALTGSEEEARHDLSDYDGVLAAGAALRDAYLERGWTGRAWTWHEAADVRVFHPIAAEARADLAWIGDWDGGERTAELTELLLEPARAIGLTGSVHGVRCPPEGRAAVVQSGLVHGGWLPDHGVPALFARHRLTVHIPRRWDAIHGVPTIHPFQALACGIPLVSAPWHDVEGLFTAGVDYLVAGDGTAMRRLLREVLLDLDLAAALSASGLRAIRARHTCGHRVAELLDVMDELGRRPRAG